MLLRVTLNDVTAVQSGHRSAVGLLVLVLVLLLAAVELGLELIAFERLMYVYRSQRHCDSKCRTQNTLSYPFTNESKTWSNASSEVSQDSSGGSQRYNEWPQSRTVTRPRPS